MRIMIDTNVLISAVYSPHSLPAQVAQVTCKAHTLVLCDYILEECRMVVMRKFPQHMVVLEELLASLDFELASSAEPASIAMSDPKDQPILDAALASAVDILITGDKHFSNLELPHLKIMTPAAFLNSGYTSL